MIIEVYRGDGVRPGSPIVEPLLSDDALIHRGRAEMDANAHAFNRIDMDVVFRPGIRLGQLIEAIDPSTAQPYRAKVTGIQITVTEASIETRLTLEQPR
ncbi:hypothetical protein [Sulfurivermis fontis]|uniref:hypothetical protein n=1 Tax=Sulfurivermis fontis TaxID=1972068 RepID=UPI000FD80381|nr:hypothetical protein [Sulfurivermis fontis]